MGKRHDKIDINAVAQRLLDREAMRLRELEELTWDFPLRVEEFLERQDQLQVMLLDNWEHASDPQANAMDCSGQMD